MSKMLLKISTLDNKISNVEFNQLSESNNYTSSLNLIDRINDNNLIDFFRDIETTIGRPLSQKEMETYINWTKNYKFSYELILYLISYCVNKNKKDFRYIEKVAISWSDTEISKPHEELFNKWLITYNMPLELIYKACDICCSKLSKPDLNYIDGILNNFKNSNIFSLKDLEKYESNKNSISKNFSNKSINKNSFSNFPQRDYDYEKLEKILTQNNYEGNNTND